MEILTLAEARGRHARAIRLVLPADQAAEQFVAKLKKLISGTSDTSVTASSIPTPIKTKAGCPIVLQVQQGQQVCEVKLSSAYALEPTEQSIAQLKTAFGEESTSVIYE